MHSFALTFAATLFFGAVSSALPIVPQVGGVANIATSAVTDVNNVVPRDDVRGIAVILTDAQGKLLPLAQQISFITSQNGTTETLTPVITEMQTVVSEAAGELKDLVGKPTSEILAGINGGAQLAVTDVAKLVGGILKALNDALDIKCTDEKVKELVKDLLQDLCKLVADLICNVSNLVGGLLSALVPTVGDVISTVSNLSITSILGALHL